MVLCVPAAGATALPENGARPCQAMSAPYAAMAMMTTLITMHMQPTSAVMTASIFRTQG